MSSAICLSAILLSGLDIISSLSRFLFHKLSGRQDFTSYCIGQGSQDYALSAICHDLISSAACTSRFYVISNLPGLSGLDVYQQLVRLISTAACMLGFYVISYM
jgi:hypothetical protein